MTVLTPANAFPGIPFPNSKSSVTVKPQSYLYPGAVQPNKGSATTVLTTTNAFPGIAFPNSKSTVTVKPQSFLYPGAVQPAVSAGPAFILMAQALL